MELYSKLHRICFMFVKATSIVLFLISGFFLIIDGNKYEFSYFSTTTMTFTFLVFALIGFILSIFGSIAIKRIQYVNLITVIAFLYITYIIVLIISLFGLIYVNTQHEFKDDIKSSMTKTLNLFKENESNKYETLKFDWLQMKLNCCGVNAHSDWKTRLHRPQAIYKSTNRSVYIDDVPDTCCIKRFKNCGKLYSDDKDKLINLIGCFKKYTEITTRNLNTLFSCGLMASLANILFIGILTVGIARNLISSYTKIDI